MIIIGTVFCIIIFVAIFLANESKYQEYRNYLDRNTDSALDKYTMNAECAETVGTAKKNLEKIQDILYDAEMNGESENAIRQIKRYESDAKSALVGLAREKWIEEANEILNEFIGHFDFLANTVPEMYNFAELNKSKTKALNLYEKLMYLRVPDVYVGISPHDYIREYLGEDYDPCMNSHWELGQKLDSIIEAAKPEKKRGEKLNREIIGFVKSKGSVKRAELKKHTFQGYTDDEVSAAYKLLIKKYKLVECKIGNRYFVSLPEKSQPSDSNGTCSLAENNTASIDSVPME